MTAATAPAIEIVAAVARNGVIGRANALPWHLPDDLKHFKSLTTGGVILMGRRTFESIGRALPGRRSIVISRGLSAPPAAGVELARSLDDAITLIGTSAKRVFVIGGAVLYAAAMPRAQVLHLTELDEPVEGDVLFPPFDRNQWRLIEEVPHPTDERHAMAFRFCRYELAMR